MINVLIADDQTLVRQGLRSLLELSDHLQVVAEAADGDETLRILKEQMVDVLLLDLQMPKLDGIQVLQAMRAHNLMIPVIVLTTFDDDERLIACSRLGARGYLLKDVSLDQLVTAIDEVAAGRTLVQPVVTQRILKGLAGSQEIDNDCVTGSIESLTSRELTVLRFLAGGYSNREIAYAMSLSEGTIKNHVSSILSKLQVRDRTRAVLKAVDMGLLGE